MIADTDAPLCIVCMEISITTTDCDHALCRDCYKKMDDLPAYQRNMKKCPYCRRDAPVLKNEVVELTDAQKLLHYTALLEYYTAHTTIVPKAAGGAGVYQRGGVVPLPPPAQRFDQARAPVRIPEGQGLRQEPPRPLHPLAAAAADGAAPQVPPPRVPPQRVHEVVHDPEWVRGIRVLLTEGLDLEEARVRVVLAWSRSVALARQVAENPRRIGFEFAGALNSRSARISLSRMNRFIIRPETREMDIFLIDTTYDVTRPAHARTHIDMYRGVTLSDLPFNTRPLAPCSCGRKTRRCCIACGCDYTCNACDQCRRCLTGEALRPLPPRFYTITNI